MRKRNFGLSALATLGLLWSTAAAAALNIAVEANPDPALPGEQLNVEILLTNDAAGTSGDVTLTFIYPVGLDALNESTFAGDCPSISCEGGELVTFTVGSVPGFSGRTFTLDPRVAAATTAGTVIEFDVDVVEGASNVNSASAAVDVAGTRILEVALAEDADPVGAGDEFRYTLDFGVDEASAGVASATLALDLPADVTLVEAPGGSLNAGTISWDVGALNPGDGGQRFAIVQVGGAVGDGEILEASAGFSGGGESVNFASSTRVKASEPLELSLVTTPNPTVTGETLDLELMITNTSGSIVNNVVIELEYPDEFSSLNESFTEGDCPSISCEGGERLVFSIASLPAGTGRVFSVPATVATDTADGSVVFLEASATSAASGPVERSTNLRVADDRDRELRIGNNSDPARPGDSITYELVFGTLPTSNGSPDARLALEVPAGASFVSASDGGSVTDGVVEWSLGALNPGESGFREATFTVDSLSDGSILPGRATFFDGGNAQLVVQADDHSRVEPAQPLRVAVASSSDTLTPGELIDVEIAISNAGPLTRTGVEVVLEYPPNLRSLNESFIRGDCPSISCEEREIAVFTVASLTAGAGDIFSLPLRVIDAPADGSTIPLEVRATDNTGAHVRASTLLRIEEGDLLGVEVMDNADPVSPGDSLVYTVAFGLDSIGLGAQAATLELELSGLVSVESASNSGVIDGSTVTWDLGALNPGAGGRRTVTVSVDGAAAEGELLAARATLSDGSSATSLQRGVQLSRVGPTTALDVELVANPNPGLPGEILEVELAVTNSTGLNRSDVRLEIEVDDGIRSINESLIGLGDCPSISCEPAERIVFDVGTLSANEGKSFLLPLQVTADSNGGSVIRFDARATDSTGENTRANDTLVVDPNRELQLSVSESLDPLAPGENVTYTLNVAQIEPSQGAQNVEARLRLPENAAFVSATDGGTTVGRTVFWGIGPLNAGEGEDLSVTATLSAGAAVGTLEGARARVEDVGSTPNPTEVNAVTTVRSLPPITFSIDASPNPADPGEIIDVELTIENTGGLDRTNVIAALEYPAGLNSLNETNTGGDCPSISCEPQERLLFDLGTLGAGELRSFSIGPTVATTTPNGSIIAFDGFVDDSTGDRVNASDDIFIGRRPPGDDDGDGMPNEYEVANQLDPQDPLDALQDDDEDGFSNLAEFREQTNPQSSGSVPPEAGIGTRVVASLLPTSRSVPVNGQATVFATMLNADGANPLTGCSIAPAAPLTAEFFFVTTDPFTNAVTGARNAAVDIVAGGSQSFVIAFTPRASFSARDIVLRFSCLDSTPALTLPGINTLLLAGPATPTPDVIALAGGTGVTDLTADTGVGAFSVATANVGSTGTIEVTADDGDAGLGLGISVCETDPGTGVCVNPTTPTFDPVTVQIPENGTPTFSVFISSNSAIPFDAAANRVYVRFAEAVSGAVRGSTSVAVRTEEQ